MHFPYYNIKYTFWYHPVYILRDVSTDTMMQMQAPLRKGPSNGVSKTVVAIYTSTVVCAVLLILLMIAPWKHGALSGGFSTSEISRTALLQHDIVPHTRLASAFSWLSLHGACHASTESSIQCSRLMSILLRIGHAAGRGTHESTVTHNLAGLIDAVSGGRDGAHPLSTGVPLTTMGRTPSERYSAELPPPHIIVVSPNGKIVQSTLSSLDNVVTGGFNIAHCLDSKTAWVDDRVCGDTFMTNEGREGGKTAPVIWIGMELSDKSMVVGFVRIHNAAGTFMIHIEEDNVYAEPLRKGILYSHPDV